MTSLKRITLILFVIMNCVGCDQVTKLAAKQNLSRNAIISYAGDTFRIQYAENPGAFLSLGASLPEEARQGIFTFGTAVIVIVLLVYLIMAGSLSPMAVVAFSLICGGGLGNLIDRLSGNGYVVDFLNIGIGSLRTGIFNIADVAIMAGAFLVLWEALWGVRRKSKTTAQAEGS